MDGEYCIGACFTGHREIPRALCPEIGRRLAEAIGMLYGKGIRRFFAGGALGFDMLAAKCVLDAKREKPDIELILALPCPDYNAKWSDEDVAVMNAIAGKSDRVVYVSECYSKGCMQTRNRFMIGQSCVCVSYYNGSHGGTEYTLEYAQQCGLWILDLYDPRDGKSEE